MNRRTFLLGASVLAVLSVSCTANQAEESTTTPAVDTTTTTTIEDLSDELDAAQSELEDLARRVEDLEGDLETVESERDELLTQLEAAQDEIAALLLAYDPEIQSAIAAGTQDVIDQACNSVTGDESQTLLASLIDAAIRSWENQPGLPDGAGESLNREAIDIGVQECFDDAVAAVVQAELTANKTDGFYTVGTEIAPGVWESQGDGDGCYWARYDSQGEINDNHFGLAGGRVTIQPSDAEVQLEGCGTWVYQG